MHTSIDVSRLIDERPMAPAQWMVAACCAVALFLGGYAILVMSLVVPNLSSDWALEPPRFGLALSAVSFGLGFAAAVIAPLGDRIGRRTLLVGALLLIGVAGLGSATATSPEQLVFWRALTGLGIGSSVPNCNAWTSEYASARGRATLIVLINAAIGAGAFSAGLITPIVLEHWGWRGTFVLGGALALGLAAVLFFTAPESLKFLVARRPGDPRIPGILKRIAPDIDPASIRHGESSTHAPKATVAELLGKVYRARTLVLWGVVLANLFTMYFLISWLPTMLQSAGWPVATAVRGASLIQLGGVVGGLLLSVFLNRGKTMPALVVAFVIAAVALGLFRLVPSGSAWFVLLLLTGGGVSGSQLALNALSTAYYPPAIKATGMAWVGVVGTLGSIISPNVGAWIIGQGVSAVNILAMLSVPPLLCLVGVMFMRREWQDN